MPSQEVTYLFHPSLHFQVCHPRVHDPLVFVDRSTLCLYTSPHLDWPWTSVQQKPSRLATPRCDLLSPIGERMCRPGELLQAMTSRVPWQFRSCKMKQVLVYILTSRHLHLRTWATLVGNSLWFFVAITLHFSSINRVSRRRFLRLVLHAVFYELQTNPRQVHDLAVPAEEAQPQMRQVWLHCTTEALSPISYHYCSSSGTATTRYQKWPKLSAPSLTSKILHSDRRIHTLLQANAALVNKVKLT